MEGPYSQETHAEIREMEEIKRERSVEGRTYTSIVENLDTGPENIIAGPNDYTL